MPSSNFQILLRILWRNRFTTFINVFGLAIGLCACLLIYIFIDNELGYDQHHSKKDRIYRISSEITLSNQTDRFGYSSFMFSPTVKKDYPEIEEAIRVMPVRKQTMWVENQPFQFENNFMSDPGFFHVFDYQFLEGNPELALVEPGSAVINTTVAKTLFGVERNVLGKVIQYARRSYKVTGVVEDQPNNSHLYFNTLLSINSISPQLEQQLTNDWFYMMQTNYILFRKAENAQGFEQKLVQFKEKHINPWLKENALQANLKYYLEPLTSIHLSDKFQDGYSKTGNPSYLYIFGCVAIFILLIACINYLNMATATASKRAKEIGIRKTSGADSGVLFWQFIGESGLIALAAILIALILVFVSIPYFNTLADKPLSFPINGKILLVLLLFLGFIGFAAGAYPAFYLSRLQPLAVLKSQKAKVGSGQWLRQILVGFQFFISVGFILCTIVVFSQLYFLKNTDTGFDKDQILVLRVPGNDSSLVSQFEVVKQELLQNPNISKMAGSSALPGELSGQLFHFIEMADHQKVEKTINIMQVSHDFVDMLGLKVVMGRNFSRSFKTDDTAAFLINEAAMQQFGWKDPFSPSISNGFGYNGHVVGVVKNFHYASLQSPIEPLVMVLDRKINGNLLLKIKAGKAAETVAFVEQIWKKYSRKFPTEYFFLDENFNKYYRKEEKMMTLFGWFSLLNIFISCLGLYALITFSLEQKVKEIGIRKVLGASLSNLVFVTSKDFFRLIGIAALLSLPVAAWAMHRWLEDFASGISLEWWMFLGSLVLVLLISSLTMLAKIFPAAQANPTDSLRTE
jgi:putative ABC transport system permease protein